MARDSILFNTDTMSKVLTGRINVYRVEVKPQPLYEVTTDDIVRLVKAPYQAGDKLYIRETFYIMEDGTRLYRASYKGEEPIAWRPGLLMKEPDYRYIALVLSVTPQKLSDMTDEDILNEGIGTRLSSHERLVREYAEWWNSLHGDQIRRKDRFRYEDDPWTWKIEFKLKKIRGKKVWIKKI